MEEKSVAKEESPDGLRRRRRRRPLIKLPVLPSSSPYLVGEEGRKMWDREAGRTKRTLESLLEGRRKRGEEEGPFTHHSFSPPHETRCGIPTAG